MPTWLPLVLLGVALLGGVGLLIYFFVGGEEVDDETDVGADTLMITAADGEKDPFATTAEEFRSTARKSRMIALKASLERSLDSREGTAAASAKDRMTMPWFMLVGADGSGKKTILGNTGLPLPWGPPIEVDSQRKDAGKWWLFEQAVVLEAPAAAPGSTLGSQTLAPGQTVSDTSVGWNTLLHMLRRERPDSPLNGIIVTISCGDLLGGRNNPERLEEQADRIRNFLERTRKLLGVRLPLHVLVTKCDTLPGFRSFADALPDSRRHDIFGWANPNSVESRFEPGWVDTGFGQLQDKLADLRDEVLAAPEQVRDSVGVFVFDSEFSDLQEPLKMFVARLNTVGERRPSLFFRGFYFTGDSLEEAAPEAPAETTLSESKPRSTTRISSEIAGEAHNLVFLRSLFSEKIFKEAGLARPMARMRLARDRRVVAAQAAALVIALGGSVGLWTAVNGYRRDGVVIREGLRADARTLARVLSGVAIDLDELRHGDDLGGAVGSERRARDAAVIELVGQMKEVRSMHVRSPFIPTSWFSPLPDRIRESMMAGLQEIVLPVMRERLDERAQRLLAPRTPEDSVISYELDPDDPRSLTKYLGDVRTLSRNIGRYNALAGARTGTVKDLAGLLDYLFGEQLAVDTTSGRRDFEEALRLASGPPIAISPAMASSVVARSVGMITKVAANAASQLAPRATSAAEKAVRPEDDLEAMHGLAALVDLIDPKRGVVASVSDSMMLGIKLASAVEDSIRSQLRVAAARIAPRDTVSPDSTAMRMRSVISTLYGYRLMERIENRRVAADIRPNERLRWDVGRLELALSLRAEFLKAVVTATQSFPGVSADRLKRALEIQLRSRAVDVASSAQRFTAIEADADPELEIRTAGANLDAAAPRLFRLATLLDSVGAHSEGRSLIGSGARQAEHALALAQAQLDQQKYLTPVTDRIAAWQGVIPIGFVALGVADSLNFSSTLARAETALRTLAHDVGPSLLYLRRPEVGDSLVQAPRLLSAWEAIAASVARYERGDATSTMGVLHRYLRESMSMSDMPACTALASVPDSVKSGADLFEIRQRQFRAAVVARCTATGAADAVSAYDKLRVQFERYLAGKYPFVDSAAVRARDAEASVIRDVFRQYDALVESGSDAAIRSDPTLVQAAKNAIAFLDQMAQARAFFAPMLESMPDAAARGSRPAPLPEYALLVGSGSVTVPDTVPAEVRLHLGLRDLRVSDLSQEETWRYGEPVSVVLVPLDTARLRTVFTAGGGWAALRLGQQTEGYARVRFYRPDTKRELPIPVFPSNAPAISTVRAR